MNIILILKLIMVAMSISAVCFGGEPGSVGLGGGLVSEKTGVSYVNPPLRQVTPEEAAAAKAASAKRAADAIALRKGDKKERLRQAIGGLTVPEYKKRIKGKP